MLQDIVPSKQTLLVLAVLASLLIALVLPASLVAAPQEAPLAAPLANDLRISQVYGGGGGSTGYYIYDYVELFNAGANTIDISGWSLQYGSATGNFASTGTNLYVFAAGTTIPAGKYLLVQLGAAGSGGISLPNTPDLVTTNLSMGAASGKVALANINTALACGATATPCTLPDARIVDLAAWGASNNAEGGVTINNGATLTNQQGGVRKSAGCQDTDHNGNDFDVLSGAALVPRNSSSPANNCGADNPPAVTNTNPANGATNVAVDATVDVTFSEPVVISGTIAIDCSSSGLQNVTPTGGPTTFDLPHSDFDLGETCTVTIEADQVTDQDGDPDNMAEDYVWSFEITDGCFSGGTTPIHDIQGAGLVSPMVGLTATVEALVIADYQSISTIRGFYVEEPDGEQDADPATSEGLFIYDNNFGVPVAAGDYVRVAGTVGEFQNQTQLTSISSVTICDGDPLTATPVSVTLPFSDTAYPERLEGMSVVMTQTLTVSENFNLGRGGILTLSNGRLQQPTNVVLPGAPANTLQAANNLNQVVLDDGNLAQNPDPIVYPPPQLTALNTVRSGDEVADIAAVFSEGGSGWSNTIAYRVHPFAMPTFTASNPRPVAPDPVRAGGSLKVSSFNVLNYFLTLDDGVNDICGPDQNAECRGADSALEFTRQRDKLLQALYILDADVVGLMELENTPGVEPLDDLVNGLNALTAPGTYDYIDAGTFVPGDVIKVGLIYKPAVVQPVGDFAVLNSLVDPLFDTDLHRPALAQTFEEIATNGRFTAVVNHLKSKGCTGAAGLDLDQGDGQSCFNHARTVGVNAELAWLATDPTNSGDPDFVIMGDLNAYAKEDPIAALEAAGYTNLESSFEGPDAYSYVFFAQAGSLDHSMASPSLTPQVSGAATWHINADEPSVLDYNTDFKSANQINILYNADAYRTSDHDPVLIGLNLTPVDAAIVLTKTVGLDPNTCATTDEITVPANTEVTYCYTVENTGNLTLNLHDLVDSELGNILTAFPYALAPDASVFLTDTTTINVTTVNTALWTAYNPGPIDVVTATATATVTVEMLPPNIFVDPLSLASTQPPNLQVVQTLTISNTGGSDLDWEILEEPVAAPAEAVQPVTRIDSQAAMGAEMAGLEDAVPSVLPQRDLAAAARAQRTLLANGLLLIPDSTNDRIMAFDPVTGNLVDANFVPADPNNLSTPKNAILSAGGNSILVSDQLDDVVQEYALDGSYIGVFAPAGGANTAILDNITGIDLRPNGNLLVTVNSGTNQDSVAEFDTSGTYLGNFVANGSGGLDGPFDVYPRAADWLVPAINSDNVLRYDLTGAFIASLAGINNFPQQATEAANSNVLVANFGGTQEGVVELTAAGALVGVYDPAVLGGYRGAYELPNGNILTTNGSGVHEIDRTGALVQTKISDVSAQYIEYVAPSVVCDSPADVPWLSTAPISGTTPAALGTDIDVTFDSTGLAAGTYNANLCVTSNDPDAGPGNETDLVIVPVALTVEAPPQPPNIFVDPLSLASSQPADVQVNQTLVISNTGGGTLDWVIDEDNVLVAPIGPAPDVAAPAAGAAGSRGGSTGGAAPIAYDSPADFSEGFDDITVLPGWFFQNNSAPLGVTDWFQGNDAVFPAHAGAPTAYIGANFNNTSGVGDISNWMLTPVLNLNNGDTISFWTSTAAGSIWPDRLELRLSTAGASTNVGATAASVGDFTTLLLSVNPTLVQGGYPETWTQYTATLSGLSGGETGRIAFRYYVTGGGPNGNNSNYIGIDTVEYTAAQAAACDAPSDIPWLSLSPANGSNGGGTATDVTVTFDSTGLTPNVYTGNLCVESNDPDAGPGNETDLVIVPVTLTVLPPTAVALTGLTADSAAQPVGAVAAMVSAFLAAMVTAVFVSNRRRRMQR